MQAVNGEGKDSRTHWQRPDAPLGTLIFREGLLSAEQLEDSLGEAVKTGKRLGQVLVDKGLLQESQVARIIAKQKGLGFVNLAELEIDPETARLLSHETAWLHHALPIAVEDDLLVVAVEDPTDEEALGTVRAALGRDARFVVATRSEILRILDELSSQKAPQPVSPGLLEGPTLNGNGLAEPSSSEPEPDARPAPVTVELSPLRIAEPEPVPERAAEPEPEPEPAAAEAPAPVPEPVPVAEPSSPPEVACDEPAVTAELARVAPMTVPDPAPMREPVQPPLIEPEPLDPEPLEPAAVEPVPPAETPVPSGWPEVAASAEPEPHTPPALHALQPVTPESVPQLQPAPPELTPPAVEERASAAQPVVSEPAPASGREGHKVVVRLTDGEVVSAGSFPSRDVAKDAARLLTRQIAASPAGEWPEISGRFIRPDLIVSVDIAE